MDKTSPLPEKRTASGNRSRPPLGEAPGSGTSPAETLDAAETSPSGDRPTFSAQSAPWTTLAVENPELSQRERQVITMWVSGMTTTHIARRLEISESAVKQYIARARGKYEEVDRPARTRIDLYRRVIEDVSLESVPTDSELINSVRGGAVDTYGQLYERHVGAAYNLARQLAGSSAEAEDLVAEAFAKILTTLREGRGPDSAFRAYLLASVRHTAYDKARRDKKVEPLDDIHGVIEDEGRLVDDLAEDDMPERTPKRIIEPFRDTAVDRLEQQLAAQAFASLPERWQTVLWHTEIEGQSPAEVAPILGLTANGVSALAFRAREGLRKAFLQVHIAEPIERCRSTVDRLGAWTRGAVHTEQAVQIEAHLHECERCRALAAELADVNGALR